MDIQFNAFSPNMNQNALNLGVGGGLPVKTPKTKSLCASAPRLKTSSEIFT